MLTHVAGPGLMLTCSEPKRREQSDVYQIKTCFEGLCLLLQQAGINLAAIFLNADAGFDIKDLRRECVAKSIEANIVINKRSSKNGLVNAYFDEQVYKTRLVIERANA